MVLSLPTGTVAFLFTDIEGSTRRWEHFPQAMRPAVERHDAILRAAIQSNGGHVFRTEGDAFRAVFSTAPQALLAALAAQRALVAEPWPEEIAPLRVRMALHTGAIEVRGGDYVGPSLNLMARLLSAAHGGQVLLSLPTKELVRDDLPPEVTLKDMGHHRLKDLIRPEQIFQVVAPGLPSEFPPLRTLESTPNNLPTEPTPIIGREQELAEIQQLLAHDVRLLTLTGPGGTGKTRLALQAGVDMVGSAQYPDGVWFVDLAPITTPSLVLTSIAQVLRVKEGAGGSLLEPLTTHLKGKCLLLILDNFEQVIDAAPDIARLLHANGANQVTIIVTSRTPLKIRGEHEYPVPPLSLPDVRPGSAPLAGFEKLTQYDAVALFIQRAQAVKPDFQVNNENAPAVAEICVKLDGLPLAIELAAARIKMLPPHTMLARLQTGLNLLTGGSRDLPVRQQTLRNAIEWSYNLLAEGDQQFFRRMAVFNGGRTFEALEAVCNYDGLGRIDLPHLDVLDGVQSLLDNSLIQQREGQDGEPRFWMLETIHEYAKEKLIQSGEAAALQKEHALYFVQLAEEADHHLDRGDEELWLRRLADEQDNMRAALAWVRDRAVNGDRDAAKTYLQLTGALRNFWRLSGFLTEAREQLTAALSMPVEAGNDSDAFRARALRGAGFIVSMQGDHDTARLLNEESLALYRKLGNKSGTAHLLNYMGIASTMRGDFADARSHLEESLALFREMNDRRWVNGILSNLGIVNWYEHDYASARALFEEHLAISKEDGDTRAIARTLGNMGELAEDEGDIDQAFALQKESLAIFRDLGDKHDIRVCLEDMARLLLTRGRADRATIVWAAAAALRETMEVAIEPSELPRYESSLDKARSLLGTEAFDKAWQEGRAMSLDQAIQYALEES